MDNSRPYNRQQTVRQQVAFGNMAEEDNKPTNMYYALSAYQIVETALTDSGCSQHMTTSEHSLFDIWDCSKRNKIADVNSMSLTKCKSLVFTPTAMDHDLVLKEVLLFPKLGMMLVFIPAVTNSGLTVIFTRDLVMFDSNPITAAQGKRRGQAYKMELIVCESLCLITKMESWHLWLGHLSDGKQLELEKFYPEKKFVAYGPCQACLM
jgi:hypothetical protein